MNHEPADNAPIPTQTNGPALDGPRDEAWRTLIGSMGLAVLASLAVAVAAHAQAAEAARPLGTQPSAKPAMQAPAQPPAQSPTQPSTLRPACAEPARGATDGPPGTMPHAGLLRHPGPPTAASLGLSGDKAARFDAVMAAEREQHARIHEQSLAQLQGLLSAEQLAQLQRRRPGGAPPPHRHGAAPGRAQQP